MSSQLVLTTALWHFFDCMHGLVAGWLVQTDWAQDSVRQLTCVESKKGKRDEDTVHIVPLARPCARAAVEARRWRGGVVSAWPQRVSQ